MPEDIYGRDSSLPDLTASQPTIGPLYENPTYTNLSPRGGFAWDVFGDGKTARARRLRAVLQHQQPAEPDRHGHQPAGDAAAGHRQSVVPDAGLQPRRGDLDRPVQFDLDNPRVHVFNVNVQRELWFRTALTIGYAGSRGVHLLRSGDVNTALPIDSGRMARVFIPAGTPRQNTSFSTIELKSSDGESWYNALIIDIRRRLANGLSAAVVVHALEERGHDAGVNVLLRCHQRHDVGDAGVHSRLQQGAVRLRHAAQLGRSASRWDDSVRARTPARWRARCSAVGRCPASG